MPYLSGQTTIRQSDLRQRWSGALRSDWSNLLSTRLSIAVENVGNRAYLSDTAASGVWTLAYSGDATVVTLTGEVVAKLTANDYFVSGLLVRSAHHSDIGSEVPYEPEVEAGLVYRRRLGEAVTLSPSILVSSRRIASPSGIPKLPAIVRADLHAEWTRWNDVRLTLDLTNVTDQRIERWNGYRERPLTVTAGMELCW
jgi:outer membrane receptor protein involved in Fe transport